jgi:hypothetical protein
LVSNVEDDGDHRVVVLSADAGVTCVHVGRPGRQGGEALLQCSLVILVEGPTIVLADARHRPIVSEVRDVVAALEGEVFPAVAAIAAQVLAVSLDPAGGASVVIRICRAVRPDVVRVDLDRLLKVVDHTLPVSILSSLKLVVVPLREAIL